MTRFPVLPDPLRNQRLCAPAGPVRMVLDTDTFNEIDDQFALTHAVLSPDRLHLEGVYAAPFANARSSGPGDGMERSYQEIRRILSILGVPADGLARRGATRFLGGIETPCPSEAAADLIERAMAPGPAAGPLYVAAIGAATNVASALLLEPRLVERIVIVWLGGHAPQWPDPAEFNLREDPAAARVLFDCGAPLVHIPCRGVASHLLTTLPEIERHIEGTGPAGDYLARIFREYLPDPFARSKVIWDLAAIAWLVNPAWIPTAIIPSPTLTADLTWRTLPGRHPIRVATAVDRDAVFGDLFTKLRRSPPPPH